MAKHEIRLTKEETEKADSLRYSWQKLQAQATDLQTLLAALQPQFQQELIKNLDQFQKDCQTFCKDYHAKGPMVPGLLPREASDRLLIFQVKNVQSNFCS
jgi:dynein heavy chain